MTGASHPAPDRERAALELRSQAESLADCRACRLCERRTQVVFGVGDPIADLMFVGEGPGFHEDRQGEPFVGQAGKLLTELLASIGLHRDDVYIANVVKCRPPENRDPLPDEIEACRPNLVRQIQTISPRVICTLGRFATRLIAETEAGISSIRGRAKQMEVAGVPVVVLPVFHPAAALYTPSNRDVLEEDFLKLRRLLDVGVGALRSEAGASKAGGSPRAVTQMAQPAAADPAAPPTPAVPAIPAIPAEAPSHDASSERSEDAAAGRSGAAPAEQLPLW